MHLGIDELPSAETFVAVEDEDAASRSAARLLITASTQRGVEALARRIHETGLRAELPFVHTWACDLPIGAEALSDHCSGFLDAAAGGSMLISDVEEMPPIVQDVLLELVVSLLDRVTAGTFSDRLFYRSNVIHLVQGDRSNGGPAPIGPP